MITIEKIESLGYKKCDNCGDHIIYMINNNYNISIIYTTDGPKKGEVREYNNDDMAWSIFGSIIETFDNLITYTNDKLIYEIMLCDETIKDITINREILTKYLNNGK